MFNRSTYDFISDFFKTVDWETSADKYLKYWQCEHTTPKSCGICYLVFLTEDIPQLEKLSLMKEIFTRLPYSTTVVVMAWIELKNIFPFISYHNVRPVDVFNHFLMRSCPDLLYKDDGCYSDAAKASEVCLSVEPAAKFLLPFIKTTLKNSCGCSTNPVRDCIYGSNGDLTETIQSRQLLVDGRHLISNSWFKQHITMMTFEEFLHEDNYGAGQPGVKKIDYGRGREQIIAKLNNNVCKLSRLLGKKYSGPDFIKKRKAMTSETLKVIFEIEQDGMKDLNFLDSKKNNPFQEKTKEEREKDLLEHQTKRNNVIEVIMKNIIYLGNKVRKTKEGEIGRMVNLIGCCQLCDLSMLPEARTTFNDLILMAKCRTSKLGSSMTMGGQMASALFSGREEPNYRFRRANIERRRGPKHIESVKKFSMNRNTFLNAPLRKKVTPKQILEWMAEGVGVYGEEMLVSAASMDSDPNDQSYTYGFDQQAPSYGALSSVVKDWKAKFPFVSGLSLDCCLNHLSCQRSLLCAINQKNCAIETDAYTVVRYKCLIPIVYIALRSISGERKKTCLLEKFYNALLEHGIKCKI